MNMKHSFSCRILLVEDDASDAHLLRQLLKQVADSTFDVIWVKSLAEALDHLKTDGPDIVLLDLTLPDSSGLKTVQAGRAAAGMLPLIVLTGHDDADFALQTLEAGAQDYLIKGAFEADDLVRAIRYAMSRAKLEQRLSEAEERWRFALEGAGDGIWDWDVLTGEVKYSSRLKAMLGYGENEMQDRIEEWTIRIHPEDAEQVNSDVQAYFEGRSPVYAREHRLRCKNGKWKWVLDRGKVVSRDAAGKPLRMIGTFTDIDWLKQAEELSRLSNTVFNTVDEALLVTDANNRIVMVNPSFTRVTGYTFEDVSGRNPSMLASGRHGEVFYHDLWEKLGREGGWCGEIWNRRKDGEAYIEWASIKQVTDAQGKPTHYVAAFSDITVRKANEENIRHQAQYDALTDLPNRVLLFDRLQQALAQAKRDKARLALMYVDLDRFKQINDSLGHTIGDLVLQQAAERMQGCVREVDTVARIGGDEFIVLLPIIENDEDALIVAEKIRQVLCQPFEISGQSLKLSSSIGIAIYPDHGTSEDEITGNADIAMYIAKEAGRDNVKIYTQGMQVKD